MSNIKGAAKKTGQLRIRCVNCCVRVNTVTSVGIKFKWISLSFLSMKINMHGV